MRSRSFVASSLCGLNCVVGTQGGLERVEAACPEVAVAIDPFGRVVQGVWIEREEVIAAGDAALHQAGALEDADVLRNGVERDVEGRGELRYARLTLAQPMQDRTARFIGKCGKDRVDRHSSIL